MNFSIYNIGKNPLCVKNVYTSCSCVEARYRNEPVPSNDSLSVTFTVKIDEVGFFAKKVRLHINSDMSPVEVILKGTTYNK